MQSKVQGQNQSNSAAAETMFIAILMHKHLQTIDKYQSPVNKIMFKIDMFDHITLFTL